MQCGRVGGRHFFEEPLSHTDLRAFFCLATECPLFTGARAPFTLRDGTPSPWEGRLALSPNSPDIASKRSGLRVRTARTGCEPMGRSAQNYKKIIRKLSQTVSSNIIQMDNSFPFFSFHFSFLIFNFKKLLPSSRDRPQTPCTSAFRAREVLLKHLPYTSRQGEVYGRRWLNTSRVLSPLLPMEICKYI